MTTSQMMDRSFLQIINKDLENYAFRLAQKPLYLMNSKDSRLSITCRKERKAKNPLKILSISQGKY